MANFGKAIDIVLKHEGGWVNNPNDSGGATNYGISLRFLAEHPEIGDFDHDGDVDAEDIKNMTVDEAKEVYKNLWWNKFHYDLIVNDAVATKIFDTAVNMGSKRSHIFAQQCLCDLGIKVTVDGILGPASRYSINMYCIDEEHAQNFLNQYREYQKNYYLKLIEKNPRLAVFKKGWLNRAMS